MKNVAEKLRTTEASFLYSIEEGDNEIYVRPKMLTYHGQAISAIQKVVTDNKLYFTFSDDMSHIIIKPL